jgi:pilus assembly protein CpaB
MELTSKRAVRSALESRTGVLIAAAVAAVLAGVLVLSAINSARNEVTVGPSSVLVANQLIPKGSTAQAISEGNLFRPAKVASDSVVSGAVTDVSQLQGKVATADIYPGQQLSASRFTAAGGAMATKLTARNRGISLPVDNAHGLIGDVRTGDRVDVYGGFNVQGSTGASSAVVKVLARDIVVLNAPSKSDSAASSSESEIVLRANDRQAANFAFTGENGKIWVVLRPSSGAHDSSVNIVTLRSLLAGVAPVAAPR